MLQIGIFAKYWKPGRVKTRLAAAIGEVQAANLYREFLKTLLDRFRQFKGRRVLAYWPADRAAQFARVAGDGWQLYPQAAGDLGQRMIHYFADAFAGGASRVALIGSDSPTVPLNTFDTAFHALEAADVVLGPADDGGYYLVGASRPVSAIFENVEWSSTRVFQQTVENLAQSNLTWTALNPSYDVDDLDDLERLRDELSDYSGKDEALIRLSHVVHQTLRKVNRDA